MCRSKHETNLLKQMGDPIPLIDRSSFKKVIDWAGNSVFFGHNRSATVGEINSANAHPWVFENIVGIHNGTLTAPSKSDLEGPGKTLKTDSEAFFKHLDANAENPEKTIELLAGAWAFVWYSHLDDCLYMHRNEDRPLFYAYQKDKKCLAWASEADLLRAAMNRRGMDPEKVFFTNPMTLYRWEIPKYGQEFQNAVTRKVEPAKRSLLQGRRIGPVGVHDGNGRFPDVRGRRVIDCLSPAIGAVRLWDPLRREYVVREGNLAVIQNTIKALSGEEVEINTTTTKKVVSIFPPSSTTKIDQGYSDPGQMKGPKLYKGYQGQLLTKGMFEDRTKCGCAWCKKVPSWGDVVRFYHANHHICMDCNGEPMVQEMLQDDGSRKALIEDQERKVH